MRAHRAEFRVTTMARVLGVSTSGFYAWLKRPRSARAAADGVLAERVRAIHARSRGTYGAPRIQAELADEGVLASRKRVARLMRESGLTGASRRKKPGTTRRDRNARPAPDLVDRDFAAEGPDRLWVADITYVRTWSGFIYVAFVTDAYSRRIVGWQASKSLRSDLAINALEQAIWQRNRTGDSLDGLIHHSDRGTQYLSIRYTERLAANDIVASVGSRGDSYDNALAESTIGLYKTELVRHRGPWRGLDDLELATLVWVDWFNHRRLHHHNAGRVPPAEAEDLHYRQQHSAHRAETQTKQPA
jgi:putative transposase